MQFEVTSRGRHTACMSKVRQIEAELQKLSPAELREVREWLENFLEDQLEFREEFEGQIRQSEREMAAGTRPRVRQLDAK